MKSLKRFLTVALEVTVILSLGMHSPQLKGDVMSRQNLCGVGPAVLDIRVAVDADALCKGGKHDCVLSESVGGGCANALRAAKQAGVRTTGVMIQANDHSGQRVNQLLSHELDQMIAVNLLSETRRSVLCHDTCFTVRPQLQSAELSTVAGEAIRQANWTLIAPMTCEDFGFVMNVLQRARRSVLQLSNSQLSAPEQAIQLARNATWTVINDRELQVWTGCEGLVDGINWLLSKGIQNFLVTSESGVAIVERGQPHFQRNNVVEEVVSTVGAGDVFTGTFAAQLCQGRAVKQAVQAGQAEAAKFLAGNVVEVATPATPVDIEEEIGLKPALVPARKTQLQRAASTALFVLLGITLGWLI